MEWTAILTGASVGVMVVAVGLMLLAAADNDSKTIRFNFGIFVVGLVIFLIVKLGGA